MGKTYVRKWWKSDCVFGGKVRTLRSCNEVEYVTMLRCVVFLVWVDDGASVKTAFSLKKYTDGRNPPDLCTRKNVGTRLVLGLDET